MPRQGFTRMFANMLDHPNIRIMLNTDYREIKEIIPYREMIDTGPIEQFWVDRFGTRRYRWLEFKHETLNEPVFPPVAVLNYAIDYSFAPVSEFSRSPG